MAKNISYMRNITDKFSIKGKLSDDLKTITYLNDDKEFEDILIEKCLRNFRGQQVEFVIAVKTNEDLGEGSEED